MARMRIGIIAPPWFCVPPVGYGGTELVVSYLADGLAERGHEVTLFASGGSRTRAKLASTFETPPSSDLGNALVESRHLVAAYARWREFDILHDHTLLGLIAGGAIPIPVVHTIHGAVTRQVADLYQQIGDAVHFVAISESQRATLPPGVRATVIHNGLRASDFPFNAGHGRYLLFVGRMNAEKGVLEAIEIARRVRMPLVMVCKINERHEQEYWERHVEPTLRGLDVEVRLEPPQDDKMRLFRDAYATLFPISWPEPFGLVMIESMATGTPVIAFRRGAVPEIIRHGETGFIVDSAEDAVGAVPEVRLLDRQQCRRRVLQHFNETLNVVRYEHLYQSILAQQVTAADHHGGRLPPPERDLNFSGSLS
jgi:glycosyltransferase involved in cell wall biosynthesis